MIVKLSINHILGYFYETMITLYKKKINNKVKFSLNPIEKIKIKKNVKERKGKSKSKMKKKKHITALMNSNM